MQRQIRPSLVFDLDQTLVNLHEQARPPLAESRQIGQGLWLSKRPYLRRTLSYLSQFYDLFILSAGSQGWVNQAVATFQLDGLFQAALSVDAVDRLSLRGPWVLIDDLPFEHPNTQRKLRILGDVSRYRMIQAPPFLGDPNDAFLSNVARVFLDNLNR